MRNTTIFRRVGVLAVATLAGVGLCVSSAGASVAPERVTITNDTAATGTDDLAGLPWGGDDDTIRHRRPQATPLVTLEQRCVRRGLCLIRVLIDDGNRLWSCRPGIRQRLRDDDDGDLRGEALDGREGHLARTSFSSGSGSGWGDDGSDDDVALRPTLTRLRLACVRIA